MSEPLLTVTSHVDGKNAKVSVYSDHIEWGRAGGFSKSKITAGIMTGGVSMLATGIKSRRGAGAEMIPIRQITSVTQRRDTMLNDVVSIVTAGNTIDMRVARAEGEAMRALVLRLINDAHSTPAVHAQAPVAPSATPSDDPSTKITNLANLHAQGILTDAEFASAKAKALGV